jgi:hypothetical protein
MAEAFKNLPCPRCDSIRAIFPEDLEPYNCFNCGQEMSLTQKEVDGRNTPVLKKEAVGASISSDELGV